MRGFPSSHDILASTKFPPLSGLHLTDLSPGGCPLAAAVCSRQLSARLLECVGISFVRWKCAPLTPCVPSLQVGSDVVPSCRKPVRPRACFRATSGIYIWFAQHVRGKGRARGGHRRRELLRPHPRVEADRRRRRGAQEAPRRVRKSCRLLWSHTLAFCGSLQAPWLHHALLSAQSPTVPTRRLDALYAKHKGKQITPQQALEELTTLVGQTTVEQAGLVLSNIQTGTLPAGCAVLAGSPACTSFTPAPLVHLHPLHPSVQVG